MITKHFFKVLIIFAIIVALGLIGVLAASHFQGAKETINLLNNKPGKTDTPSKTQLAK